MFAVIESGGKQYRVQQGDVIRVETLGGDAGEAVEFENVLMIRDGDSSKVGSPMVDGAKVSGTVVKQGRAKKILLYTYKVRQNSNRKQGGHRQNFTEVKIDSIEG
jgi:large subunit ribosomal protein L21